MALAEAQIDIYLYSAKACRLVNLHPSAKADGNL